MIQKFLLLICFSFVWVFPARAQDSSHIKISLLTCSPGDELYSIFGHSAIRIVDSTKGSDVVYNYGTFDFDDASFYLKFIRGKLLYYVSAEYFGDFQYLYNQTGRKIIEQDLMLTPEEKLHFKNALNENLKEENKFYKYDFFFDNCTTRLRDWLLRIKKNPVVLPAVMPEHTTFRNAIHQYLDNGHQHWSKLGIDILLGAKTDRIMKPSEQQFLPDNLMFAIDKSAPPVILAKTEFPAMVKLDDSDNFFTPFVCFTAILLLFVVMQLTKNKPILSVLNGLDGMLFFITGALGFILIFMWTGTDHSMTKNNYNLLWAWPTHITAAFFINSSKNIAKKYFLFTAVTSTIVLSVWFFLPQQMNLALIPVVILLIYRSAFKYLNLR